jgi:signal transduction histidine kinase
MGNTGKLLGLPLGAVARWFLRRSIVLKMTVFVGALLALLAGALIAVVFHYTGEMLRDQINNRLAAVADDRLAMLRRSLAHLEERARIFASRYRVLDFLDRNSGAVQAAGSRPVLRAGVLDDVRNDTEGLLAFWVEDRSGRRIAASGPDEVLAAFAGKEESRQATDRDPGLVGLPRPAGGTFGVLLRTTATTRQQGVIGTFLLVLDMGPLMTDLADPRWLGESGELLVGVRQGETTRFLFPPRLSPHRIDFPASRTEPMNRAIAGTFGFDRTVDRLGRDVLAAYRPLPEQGWGLVAKLDAEEAYAPVRLLGHLLLAIGGSILALGLGASYLISRQNTAPIRRLAAAADAIARGQPGTPIEVRPGDEIGTLGRAFSRMSEQVARSQAELETRITERTRELAAMRDLLDAFFQIFTSRLEPHNIDRTFESVLRFCHQLGYDLAMISLVDREQGVIRAVRGAGSMADVVGLTVRSLDGDDILAQVVRHGHAIIVADSVRDPRCDPSAVRLARIHGQVVLPLVGDEVLGTLQVATPETLDPERVDLRPLESLSGHTARALSGLRQVEEIDRLNRSLEEKAEELLKSEGALREQTRILRSVLDCMREGVVVADRESKLLLVNPAAERNLGRTGGLSEPDRWNPVYGVYHADRVTPYTVEELPLSRAIRGESLDEVELYVSHASLQQGLWVLVNARPLRDDHGAVQGGLVVFHDVTRRKNNERRLAAQFATTRVLTEADSLDQAASRILAIVGEQLDWDLGTFWRLDRGAQRLRCSALWLAPGRECAEFAEGTRKATFGSGEGPPGRVWTTRRAEWIDDLASEQSCPRRPAPGGDGPKSGLAAPILARGECLGVLELYSRESRPPDEQLLEMMTNLGSQVGQFIERQQMHARVVQSEKLASLGLLSAGLAHEINNPLAYIGNNLAVLERDIRALLGLVAAYERSSDLLASHRPELLAEIEGLSDECDFPYLRENLDKLLASTRQGVTRLGEIVRNLRGFARLDRPETDQLDLRDALNSAMEMIRGRLARRHIAVEQDHDDLPLISASPVQINQVFLNLLVNAMQAIEATHREDGRIAIRFRASGNEVEVEISDNGCGIPSEVLPKVFDPFFTTKSVGDGTGLGLSITHGIVQDHGGRLEVESTPGEGTSFHIFLPVSRK